MGDKKKLNEEELEKVAGGNSIYDCPKRFEDGTRVKVFWESGFPRCQGTLDAHLSVDFDYGCDWRCIVRTDNGEEMIVYECDLEAC